MKVSATPQKGRAFKRLSEESLVPCFVCLNDHGNYAMMGLYTTFVQFFHRKQPRWSGNPVREILATEISGLSRKKSPGKPRRVPNIRPCHLTSVLSRVVNRYPCPKPFANCPDAIVL